MVGALFPVIASSLTGVYQNKRHLGLTFDPPEFTPPPIIPPPPFCTAGAAAPAEAKEAL